MSILAYTIPDALITQFTETKLKKKYKKNYLLDTTYNFDSIRTYFSKYSKKNTR